MEIAALSGFQCVKCRAAALRVETPTNDGGELRDGTVLCGACGSRYQVRKGVPRFVPDQGYAGSFGFQWNKFRRTQLDSYTKLPLSSDRLFHVTQWSRDLTGQTVLEAGSGAGRFSEVLLRTGATLYSFDLSDAVEANFENNGRAPNLRLFQASIYDVP